MDHLAKELAACGLRVTVPRLAIYAWLREHPVHPTADVIWQALLPKYPGLSLTTVYNTVHALARHGLIRTVNIQAEEQRFDGDPSDHGHFHCRACGRLYDFRTDTLSAGDYLSPRFVTEKCDLFVTGLCEECAG